MKSKLLLASALLLLSVTCWSQSEPTYYVTIGVFGVHSYAEKNTEIAIKNKFDAKYEFNAERKLYYIYIFSSSDKATAIARMLKTRVETDYKEAWVFKGTLGEGAAVTSEPVQESKKPEPIKVDQPVVVKPMDVAPVKKDSVIETPPIVKDDSVSRHDSVAMVLVVEKPVEKTPVVKPAGVPFFFKLVNAESGAEIVGEIHVQESAKASQYQAFRGNEIVYIKPPVNPNGTYIVVTQAPGYQQVKTTITYKEPGLTKGPNDEYVIPLDLQRAKHGDYIDFNNVKFVRNSSVMLPESQTELDGLVLLMKENPKYKIKIHGHCNGKADREITLRGTSPKFFAMDPSGNKKTTTSAMVLSQERASSVKDYIVQQGIEAGRIATKAEGGKIPLYSSNSTLASYNDRVEVEIKKN